MRTRARGRAPARRASTLRGLSLRALALGVLLGGCAGARTRGEPTASAAQRADRDSPKLRVQRSAPAKPEPATNAALRGAPDAPGAPLGLDELLERIAAANPTLEGARARLARAEAAGREARAELWPQLTLGVDLVRTDEPARAFGLLLDQRQLDLGPGFDATPPALTNWREQVQLDWAVLAPGRRARRLAADEGEQAARLEAEALERRLLNEGVQAWVGLRASRALERVARESVAVVAQRLELTRRRREAGASLRADVLRLEVRLAQARQEEASATLAARRAESGLRLLIGAEEGALELADEEPVLGAELPREEADLLELARRERRDLAAAAHRVRMLAHGGDAARAAWLPQLSLFATYMLDGEEPGFERELDSYALGLGLRLPLSAATAPRVAGARAAEREARARLRELTLALEREVRDAREAVLVAERTLELAESALGAAEEAYRMVAEAQDAGAATVTDALEAQDAREQAAVRAVAARAGLALARARLVAATGGVR